MTTYLDSHERIQTDFVERGIPIDQPGFYDHPKFIAVERAQPEYLNHYATALKRWRIKAVGDNKKL